MSALRVANFDGTLLEDGVVFITDSDTDNIQYAIEPVDDKVYDLTFAAIDDKQKRKEYVLTMSEYELDLLARTIQKVLEINRKRGAV